MKSLMMKTAAAAAIAAFASVAMAEAELVIIPVQNPNNHPLNIACKLLTTDEAQQVIAQGPFVAWEVATSADGTATGCRFMVQGTSKQYAYFRLELTNYGSVDAAKTAWAEREKSMQETVDMAKREMPGSKGTVTHVPGFGDDALTFGDTGEAISILKGQHVLTVNDVTYDHLNEAQVISAANLALPRI